MRIFILATLLLAVVEQATAETGLVTPQQIRTAATAFLQAFADEQAQSGYQVEFDVGQLDPRLNLTACATPPKVAFSGDPWQSTQPTLLVQCQGQRPWRMYLPSKVAIHGQVFIASRPVARGERITQAVIASATSIVNGSRRAPITELEHLLGKEASRSLNQGAVFTPAVVEQPDAVQRGDHVIITARSGSYIVRSRGKALASGQTGEQVMVENLSSARRIRGLVVGPGRVEIPM